MRIEHIKLKKVMPAKGKKLIKDGKEHNVLYVTDTKDVKEKSK